MNQTLFGEINIQMPSFEECANLSEKRAYLSLVCQELINKQLCDKKFQYRISFFNFSLNEIINNNLKGLQTIPFKIVTEEGESGKISSQLKSQNIIKVVDTKKLTETQRFMSEERWGEFWKLVKNDNIYFGPINSKGHGLFLKLLLQGKTGLADKVYQLTPIHYKQKPDSICSILVNKGLLPSLKYIAEKFNIPKDLEISIPEISKALNKVESHKRLEFLEFLNDHLNENHFLQILKEIQFKNRNSFNKKFYSSLVKNSVLNNKLDAKAILQVYQDRNIDASHFNFLTKIYIKHHLKNDVLSDQQVLCHAVLRYIKNEKEDHLLDYIQQLLYDKKLLNSLPSKMEINTGSFASITNIFDIIYLSKDAKKQEKIFKIIDDFEINFMSSNENGSILANALHRKHEYVIQRLLKDDFLYQANGRGEHLLQVTEKYPELHLQLLNEFSHPFKFLTEKEHLNFSFPALMAPKSNSVQDLLELKNKFIIKNINNKILTSKFQINSAMLNRIIFLKQLNPNLDEQLLLPLIKEYSPSDYFFLSKKNIQIFKLFFQRLSVKRQIKIVSSSTNKNEMKDTILMLSRIIKEAPEYLNNFHIKTKSITDLHDQCSYIIRKLNHPLFSLNQKNNILQLEGAGLKEFTIKIPKTSHDLLDLGDALSICVGNGYYAQSAKRGMISIIALYKENKPHGCIEIRGNKIVQAKGHRNQPLDIEYQDIPFQEEKIAV